MDFIARQLPNWRDDVDRPQGEAETVLTDQLCSYLNGACYSSQAWSHIQFRTETRDEKNASRSIDLTPKPMAAHLIIEGRRHTQYETLFPIECKRLPTPRERDQREYVSAEPPGTAGGMQRFKFGLHGASHNYGGMIAYVQQGELSTWLATINGWISELASGSSTTWDATDALQNSVYYGSERTCTHDSKHMRPNGLPEIALRHIWISMN